MAKQDLNFTITASNEDLIRKLRESRQAILDSGKTAETTASRIDGSFKRMAGGIAAIGGGVAIGAMAKELYNFSAAFDKSMREVSTISQTVTADMDGFKQSVLEMTTQIPVGADAAAKALYQIISAGHDGAKGMQVLEVSAKAAVGGVTETATAADAITTVLNAYKKGSEEAESVSDQLFTTVRLGKTTFGELGRSISQAVPIAASFGVETEQVLAAVATLTKSGTPTAQAMTQIRASIIAASKVLGDGYFQTHTFQEGLAEIAKRANGSEAELRKLVPEIEAVNGVLGLTGLNAKTAASDLAEIGKSAGATQQAYKKMSQGAEEQLTILKNNTLKKFHEIGESGLDVMGGLAKALNTAFETGAIDDVVAIMGVLIAAIGVYKAQLLVTNAIKLVGNNLVINEEIKAYQALLPIKEASKNKDIEIMVAKGQLSQKRAEELVAIRAEVQAELEKLKVKARVLAAKVAEATKEDEIAKKQALRAERRERAAMSELSQAQQRGKYERIRRAETRLTYAQEDLNIALKEKEVAANALVTVSSKAKSAATAVDTMQTNINSAANTGAARAKTLWAAATGKLTNAFKSLKLAFASNPIGLIITAVTTAITAFSMFKSKTEDATDALEEFNKKQSEQRQKAESLIRIIQDENETEYAKIKAYEELAGIMPNLTKLYDIEAIKLLKTADAQKELNKARDEADYKNITDNIGKYSKEVEGYQKVVDTYKSKKFMSKEEAMAFAYVSAQLGKAKEDLTTWEKRLADYERKVEKANEAKLDPEVRIAKAKANLKDIETAFEEAKAKMEEEEKKLAEGKIVAVDLLVQVNYRYLKSEKEKQQGVIEEVEKSIQKPTYKQEYDAAAKEWKKEEAELRKIEAQKDKFTKEQYREAKKNRDEAKSIFESLGGVTKVNTEGLKDYHADVEQLMLKTEQMKIEVMQEGRAKELAQIELTRQEKLTAIDKEQKEIEAKLKEQGKQLAPEQKASFDTQRTSVGLLSNKDIVAVNKKYDDEIADGWKALTDVFLTEEEKRTGSIKNEYKNRRKWLDELSKGGSINREEYVKMSLQIDASEAQAELQPLLEQYQTYADKRKEIEEKFNSEIATMRSKNEDGKYDAQIKQAEKQKNEALSKTDFEEQKKGIDFTQLFGNLDNLTLPSMKSLRDKIKAWIDSAGKSLSPEDLKAVSDAFLKLEIKIADKDPFSVLKSSIVDYKKSTKEVAEAQEVYNKALRENGKDSEVAKQAAEKLTQAQEKRAASLAKANEAIKSVANDGQQIVGAAQDVISILSDLGVKVPENVEKALGGIGQVMDGLATIDLTQPLSIVTGAVKMIGGLVTTITSLFNGDNKRSAEIERLQGRIDALSKSYEALEKSADKAYSTDASDLLEQQNELIANQKKLIQMQIAEEEAKKNTDDGKIEEWKKQLDELDEKISDNKDRQIEVTLGSDYKSDVDSFVSYYLDSLGKVGNGAADFAKQTKKNIVTELLKKDIGDAVEKMRAQVDGLMADGDLSEADMAEIDRLSEEVGKIMDQRGKAYEKILGDEAENPKVENSNSLTGQIKGSVATEASVAELGGLFRSQTDSLLRIDSKLDLGFGQIAELARSNAAIEANTLATANNTANTVTTLANGFNLMQTELTAINKNTSKDTGSYGG